MASQDWMTKDFYAVLGVAKDADSAAIKKAYRKLAKHYHPDRNPDDAVAAERFKEVGEAYAVLSDAKEREQYDAIRNMTGGGARFTAGGTGGGGGFEDILSSMFGGGGNVRFSAGGTEPDLDELLRMFGGTPSPTRRNGRPGAFNFGGFGGAPEATKGSDVITSATLSLRDAVAGATVELTADKRTMTVRIPAGVHDGQRIRLAGKGRPGNHGGPNGDMIVTISVAKHPVYSIDGANLRMDLPVSLAEAALGADVEVPLLNGSHKRVRIKPGTPSGTVLRIPGAGIATAKHTGDLLVTVEVAVPKKLSKSAKKALQDFDAAMEGTDPRATLRAEAAR
ncbi:DnaJ C-terminal domain-containing protein [Actinomyces gaoshouyii]|uniref:Molecular chaperone DnaJ n=1 Tax=Actinomyces gaoshouyii TaxID=1960083 RepID=A0A8H9H728_9ACTO|nr:DnaJ C-terminal domain-containing protein [Actinomyces gaoshouyii]GGO94690.1 molecular chaperone DnaJ [Actinomyces gaoshouyii]